MRARCYFIGTTLGDNPVPHHFVTLAGALVARGHRVVIIAPHRRVDLANPTGNPAIHIWPSDRPTRRQDALFLRRLIAQYRPDCLVANFVAVNLMSLVGWFCGVPRRVAWYHTLSSQIEIDGAIPRWRLELLRLRKGLAYRASTHVVGVSQAAADDFAQVYPACAGKARVFLNALADPLAGDWSPAPTAEPHRLVCVARLTNSKGQDVLIRAVARLRDRYPKLRVEFVGDGPALATLTNLAREVGVADCCDFVGRVNHDEVLRRMAAATATVLPSRSDAFALVTIESLAVGTPVVAARVGGVPEIIRDGNTGFLLPPDDPPALAEKLDRLLSDSTLRRQFQINARRDFLARFDLLHATPRQADWLEEIVN